MFLSLLALALPGASGATVHAEETDDAARGDWPAVLLIDDFESGLDRWAAEGTGELALSDDAPQGDHALRWTAGDDGLGHIVFQNLSRDRIDFSQYDLLMMRVKVAGKPIWNLNPIIQQYPAVYGYRGLYYSIDTMHPFDQWFTFTQDLSRWENAWPDTYDQAAQEFQFEVHQLAGAGRTEVYLDDVRLLKNPLALEPAYPARWGRLSDGTQVNHFELAMTNRSDQPLTVRFSKATGGTLDRFELVLPSEPIHLLPDERATARVRMIAPSDVVAAASPFHGETARIACRVEEIPELVLFTELTGGARPETFDHPSILCDPPRMQSLQAQYADPAKRQAMDKRMLALVREAEAALAREPRYPALAATGRKKDPVSGGALEEADVPNLPFRVYQDPESGRTYSGPLYDAGMQNWLGQHMGNAAQARKLAMGYLITGRKDFANAAARILREYTDRYLELPMIAYEPGSPVGSAVSGSTRIGGTYMRERVWLTNLAVALDSIRPADVLSRDEIERIAQRVFQPSANNMMNHKVGAMNLQWQIQSAALFAGLATETPSLVTRAMHSRHGIVRLMDTGFLEDGQWWENPSYQGVTKLAAYPALSAAMHNGLMPFTERMEKILKAGYQLHGPDGRSPTLGTGGWRSLAFENTGVLMFAPLSDNPELAWIAHHRQPHRGSYGLFHHALFRQTEPNVSEDDAVSPIPESTTHMPDYGGLALRVPGTDMYCYFHYGRELVHGHRNKLSINAYGKGGWFVRNVIGGYQHNFDEFLETIASASTIIVDGQNPDHDTGELLFHKSLDGIELASARERGAWKDAEHERSLVLTDNALIVIDRALSERERTYDWLYHANFTGLSPQTHDADAEQQVDRERFGETSLYDSLQPTSQPTQAESMRWQREDGSGLIIARLPHGEMFGMRVEQTMRPHEGLLWRQRNNVASFVTAFVPFEVDRGDSAASVTIEPVEVHDAQGQAVDLRSGQAVRVELPERTLTVLVNYTGETLRANQLESSDRVAVHEAR
ncbi:MAG: hypothetical protein ACODAQ_00035 [Phycisphaeraceae bacterium]